jgi:hypothetical protein
MMMMMMILWIYSWITADRNGTYVAGIILEPQTK